MQAEIYSCAILYVVTLTCQNPYMKQFVLPVLTILLTSCATPQSNKETDFFANIPAGSTLAVNSPLTIAANEVRASLQFGRQVSLQQLDKWEPYCQLVVRTLSRQDKVIPAVDFRITRVVRDEEPYTRLKNSNRTMIASTDENLSFLYSGDTSYTWLIKTYMDLESNDYPDIYRFVCGQVWDGYTSRRLYMSEFNEAAGDFITIVTAGTQAGTQ